ncbi:MAG: pyridoxal-phosphate dependent enzyme [Nostoc sp. ChiSLP02]|nr:pyridoxal-phosphate dependent enzyme [Nostoc sp. DedSLP05]MDZ8101430.1 pyridoxal-phosphate dependent enzyme [Nostoc sp. DedSLP01]MDZ8188236.1 pyridoxal-phosphate dependent enzyme [Nostoc sp. ChiSLP02]
MPSYANPYIAGFLPFSSRRTHVELGSEINAFVAAVGSGGTFVGTSKFLKQKNRNIVCAVVEPEGVEVLAGKSTTNLRHNMQGIGYGIIIPQWDASIADVYLAVNSEEASFYRKALAQKEGLYVGYSALVLKW